MTSTEAPQLCVRSPADLIAAVPYLLGFHPSDSIALVAMRRRRIVFAARYDLPHPDDPTSEMLAAARYTASIVARQQVDAATVIGYGDEDRAAPAVRAISDALAETAITIHDQLRVADGRFWSLLCRDADCCPPDGTPYEAEASVISAAATFAGQVVLPDRESLARQIAPVEGAARDAMREASRRADLRLDALFAEDRSEESIPEPLRRAGAAAIQEAMETYRLGGGLSDDEVAWLSILLAFLPVRDIAWERIGAQEWQVALWTDVVRRAEPDLAPAPACLLGFAAWRSGQGALASVAVDRALAVNPDYSMALLLQEILLEGLPPSALRRLPMADQMPPVAPRGRRKRGTQRRSVRR